MKTFMQHLNELGDSRNPYPFKYRPGYDGGYLYHFKTDSGFKYEVDVAPYGKDNLHVGFSTEQKGVHVTNAGLQEAFRVVATAIAATKDAIARHHKQNGIVTKQIYFDLSKMDSNPGFGTMEKANQRFELYMAFIKKELNISMVTKSKNGESASITLKSET